MQDYNHLAELITIPLDLRVCALRYSAAMYFITARTYTSHLHRRAVAQHCINGDSLSQWGRAKFDPLQNGDP